MGLNVYAGQLGASWRGGNHGTALLSAPAFLKNEGDRGGARGLLVERFAEGGTQFRSAIVVE
jgi:hypothetical protein